MSERHYQIAVVGSGFAGSLTAMIARRLGLTTVLIERRRHPRFAIGESSTPLANLLLEEIADEYDLPLLRPLAKWGTWQKQLPHLSCGLKRGFTFYHHKFGEPFLPDPQRERQLLVGASPNERVADTHWYRPDFDHYLMQQAQELGVSYSDETTLVNADDDGKVMRLTGFRRDKPVVVTAEFVIDATGPRGFLQRMLNLPEKSFAEFPATQALYAHFKNVGVLPDNFGATNTALPYPPEQAAVHHVFPGGWIWVLKFNNGITSAGVAAEETVANEFKLSEGEAGWQRLLARLPSVAEIFRSARAVTPLTHVPRLAFQSEVVSGERWTLLPYAAGFVDPLLSTGFPLTLLGISRLARLLKSHWQQASFAAGLAEYSRQTILELETSARLVGALYATMDRFEVFREVCLLYFAAASYAETVRRLGKVHLADSFFLCRHPEFGPQFRQICELAKVAVDAETNELFKKQLYDTIEPFDLIGLTDRSRCPWYPALVSDLRLNAAKVGASHQEIEVMISRCS